VIRYWILQAEAAEPPICQIQMHFLAQPPLGSDAEAVADNEHPHHELAIDRRSTGMAIEGRKVFAKFVEIEESIDAAQQMSGRNVIVDVEEIKESFLTTPPRTHHPDVLR
jgi:hypothetical protein